MNRDAEVIAAIKAKVGDMTKRWAVDNNFSEEIFVDHNGVTTSSVAYHMGIGNKEARKLLDEARSRGLVLKGKKNCGSRCCRWWPVGYIAELKAK